MVIVPTRSADDASAPAAPALAVVWLVLATALAAGPRPASSSPQDATSAIQRRAVRRLPSCLVLVCTQKS